MHPLPEPSFSGSSPAIRRLLEAARNVAQNSDHPVLISGPIGAGKSHLARVIHRLSVRKSGPLIFVDCGGLSVLETTLYGHTVGAFTGAVRSSSGRLEEANGGVLVLDDIDRLCDSQQDRLLRVLADGTFYRLGATTPSTVDVRFLATTNKDVKGEIEKGRLKADFISRLDYFELVIPPLSERAEDIPHLCRELVARLRQRYMASSAGGHLEFEQGCWEVIAKTTLPDNVRGLEKLLVRALSRLGSRNVITVQDILLSLREPHTCATPEDSNSLRAVRAAAERAHILKVCSTAQFNLRLAARILGIAPKSLYAKLRSYGISRPPSP